MPDGGEDLRAQLPPATLAWISEQWETRHPAAEDPFTSTKLIADFTRPSVSAPPAVVAEGDTYWRELLVGVAVGICIWPVATAGAIWFAVREAKAEPWWSIVIGAPMMVLVMPFMAALFWGAAAGMLTRLVHRLSGCYRCIYCGLPVRRPWANCPCEEAAKARQSHPARRSAFLRHLERQLKWVALTWVLLLPLAVWFAGHAADPERLASSLLLTLGLFGNGLGALLIAVTVGMKYARIYRRRRLLLDAFGQALFITSSALIPPALLSMHW